MFMTIFFIVVLVTAVVAYLVDGQKFVALVLTVAAK